MENKICDLIILGSGCAGLTAGIYAGRAGLNTFILESGIPGGQAAITGIIGNYPGIPDITGPELMHQMLEQAKSSGAQYLSSAVKAVELSEKFKIVKTDTRILQARALIIATGATPKKLGFEGEDTFKGRGISYCATCDGFFFRNKDIFVVGGGNSAAEEALYLTRFARHITMLVRKDTLRCEKYLADQLFAHPKISVSFNTELIRAFGKITLEGIDIKNNLTGAITTHTISEPNDSFGVFIFVGYEPASALFTETLKLDTNGYICTNEYMETSIPGVFAAGDVRHKELRQLVTAAADGAIAATQAEKYIHAEDTIHRLSK